MLEKKLIEYLDCECEYFEQHEDPSPILAAYEEAKILGLEKGFTPILITVDEVLLETLIANSDESASDSNPLEFNIENVRRFRKEILASSLDEDFEAFLDITNEAQQRISLEKGESDFADGLGVFIDEESTLPLVLAKIPVSNPWQVYGWVPFGQFNECPDPVMMMAITKNWYELFGATPATISASEMEMQVPCKLSDADAFDVAVQMSVFDPDLITESMGDIKTLAATLEKNTTWYFWWN